MIDVVSKYGLDLTGNIDNAPKLATMAADIAAIYAAKKPMPRLVFTEGDIAFRAWPDLAYPGLQLVAEGECRLRPQGCTVVFDASLRNPSATQPGIANLLFSGFSIYGSPALVAASFRGIHRSRLQMVVESAPGGSGVELTFCIITTLEPQVRGGQVGLLVDAWPGKPTLQPTACTIVTPCLENCAIGMALQSAGSCMAYGGTIESCGVGVHLGPGAGNNTLNSVEMEGNGQDVQEESGAHNNGFLYCGNSGKLTTNFSWFSSNWVRN